MSGFDDLDDDWDMDLLDEIDTLVQRHQTNPQAPSQPPPELDWLRQEKERLERQRTEVEQAFSQVQEKLSHSEEQAASLRGQSIPSHHQAQLQKELLFKEEELSEAKRLAAERLEQLKEQQAQLEAERRDAATQVRNTFLLVPGVNRGRLDDCEATEPGTPTPPKSAHSGLGSLHRSAAQVAVSLAVAQMIEYVMLGQAKARDAALMAAERPDAAGPSASSINEGGAGAPRTTQRDRAAAGEEGHPGLEGWRGNRGDSCTGARPLECGTQVAALGATADRWRPWVPRRTGGGPGCHGGQEAALGATADRRRPWAALQRTMADAGSAWHALLGEVPSSVKAFQAQLQ
eukprot:gene17575-20927_t